LKGPTLLEQAEQVLERINRERQAHQARMRALDEQRQRAADEVARWHAHAGLHRRGMARAGGGCGPDEARDSNSTDTRATRPSLIGALPMRHTQTLARPCASASPGVIWRNGARVRAKQPAPREPVTLPSKPQVTAIAAPEHQAREPATRCLEQSDSNAATATLLATPSRPAHPLRDQAPLPVSRFWFVWGVGEAAPKRRHETLEGARGEARRLAELHPAAEFLVFAAELMESAQQEGERS
jgi:hypothetical protein